MKRTTVFMAALLVLPGWTGAAHAQGSLQCERCHGEMELLRQHVRSFDEARGLLVEGPVLRASAHGALDCTRCHTGFSAFPHPATVETRTCVSCHEAEAAAWAGGIHDGAAEGETVSCARCHGVHDVADTASLAGGEGLRAMNATCAGCHETQRLTGEDPHTGKAGCWDCHGAHDVLRPSEADSWVAAHNQPRVCGACHDSIAGTWVEDVHGQALAGAPEAEDEGGATEGPPSCSRCHGAHPITTAAGERRFSEAAVERCIGCHERAGSTFYGSYHGKATEVGSHVAATCVDCHGAHRIFPAADPRSTVAAANLVETCSACHAHARAAFVKYDSHPEPLNRHRNPWIFASFLFMNTVLIGTLLVFGAHTVAWWIRTTLDRRRGISAHGGGGGE